MDYSLQRRAVLADVYAGRTGLFEVCDASPYLTRAAKYHGEATDVVCPVCRKVELTLVSYVYGEHLGTTAGQAKTQAELARMDAAQEEFSPDDLLRHARAAAEAGFEGGDLLGERLVLTRLAGLALKRVRLALHLGHDLDHPLPAGSGLPGRLFCHSGVSEYFVQYLNASARFVDLSIVR